MCLFVFDCVCLCSGGVESYEKFYIYNNSTREIRFEMMWSGKMLSLTPDSGSILGRLVLNLLLFYTLKIM